MANTPVFALRLPPDLRARLQRIADAERRTLAQIMVFAAEAYADAHEQPEARPKSDVRLLK